MAISDHLPSDSVLRRHMQTERNRVLGLPPTDAVLRRHHAQWTEAQRTTSPAPGPASFAPPVAPPGLARAMPAAVAANPVVRTDGGLLGWLRRLLSH